VQHAGAGGRVVVAGDPRDERAGAVDVSDTGPGIPKADREGVFEMFFTTRPQGTGLGALLARTAVEQNGGTLAAVGPEGPGACFRLEFPLAEKEPT
jgi:signal transduction histidine kinase